MRQIAIQFIFMSMFALAVNSQTARTITVVTEPGASVYVGGVLYGKTGEDGRLSIRTVAPGQRTIRVRAAGFSEATKTLTPTLKGNVAITLTKTTNAAELAFQEGERQASLDRAKAIAAFRDAIKLNPKLVAAHLALARNLSESGDHEGAMKAIAALKKISPRNAEASAIEGRILKDTGEEAKAIAAFKRSIAEGRGFQPEAYAGLGLLYNEKAEGLGDTDDAQSTALYNDAAKNLATAAKQLASAPDATVIMQLVGLIYEKQKRFKEAIEVYEEFLKLFPDSPEAEAVRSFIVQIRKEIAGERGIDPQ